MSICNIFWSLLCFCEQSDGDNTDHHQSHCSCQTIAFKPVLVSQKVTCWSVICNYSWPGGICLCVIPLHSCRCSWWKQHNHIGFMSHQRTQKCDSVLWGVHQSGYSPFDNCYGKHSYHHNCTLEKEKHCRNDIWWQLSGWRLEVGHHYCIYFLIFHSSDFSSCSILHCGWENIGDRSLHQLDKPLFPILWNVVLH